MAELISVIIPVYNAEMYISECLHSVIDQTYSNLEILVVDDGSVDNSREICNGISRADRRICVLHQEHQGVSAARNRGIEAAKGKYLFFLDGDDVIHAELLEILYRLAEMTGASIATEYYCWKAENLYSETEMPGRWSAFLNRISGNMPQKNMTDDIPFEYIYLKSQKILQELPVYGKQGGIGGKMIRHTVVQSFGFDVNLIAGEDTKFLYQLVLGGADAVILHKDWYYYRRHKDNIGKKYKMQVCQSNYECIRYICDYEKECGRRINAVHIEEYLVRCIIRWVMGNRKIHDKETLKCLRGLARIERKQVLFSQVNWHIKKDFYLMVYCYPLYWVNSRISKEIK